MAQAANRQKEIFFQALDLPTAERAAFLTQACGGDETLRRQIDALLQAHAAPDSFLERPAVEMEATLAAAVAPLVRPPTDGPGTQIGPYKLLEQIGEGGMGTVWMAEQTAPVKRLVALKLIKAGMDSGQVLARFEAERQALALMDHPNIAKVLDAGTSASGQPYFVMELVKGVPITKYCDERRLRPRERLALFVPVCQAVQHAHQKGIIHRDLKPSNVLVALYDGRPVPKVIDFGIAKATQEKLTERTLFTGFGALVGTLEYMSPEQAELNQLDVDTRSDIYSLGVLLYELLTGSTPLGSECIRENALLDVLLMIHKQEPPKPSARLSTSKLLATLSEQRQTEPAKLARLVRGELDWIVMKALAKDRGRRYQTALNLAHEVERYLADEPVQAGPPSTAYRLRKFVKRNRGPVLAGTLLLLTLVGGIIGTTASLFEARWQRDEAVQARLDESAQRERAEDAEQKAKANETSALAAEGRATKALTRVKKLAADEKLARQLAVEREQTAKILSGRVERSEAEVKRRLLEATQNRFTAQVVQAAALWQHDPLQGLKILRNPATCPPRDRDFTWHFYHRLCDVERTVFPGATGKFLECCALSPNRKWLAAGGAGGAVNLWDFATGARKHHLQGHKADVNAVVFSRDGKTLFSAGDDRVIYRWDVESGKRHDQPFTMPGEVGGLALHPDGRRLAAGSYREDKKRKDGWRVQDGAVVLWDVVTGEKKEVRKGLSSGALHVAFSPPDGKYLAAGFSHELCVRVWETETGKEYVVFRYGGNGWVHGLAFSHDGKYLAVATAGTHIHLFDVAQKKQVRTFEGHQQQLGGVAFSPNDRLLVSGGYDQTVRVWELEPRWGQRQPRELMVLPGYERRPVRFTPDGRGLLVQKFGSLVHLVPALQAEDRTIGHQDGVLALAYPPDGRYLASGHKDNSAHLWDAQAKKSIHLGNFADAPRCLVFSPDGKTLFVGSARATPEKKKVPQIARWDVTARKWLAPWPGHDGAVVALAVSPRQGLLASGGQDGVVKLWDLATGKEVGSLTARKKSAVLALAFHPTERMLAGRAAGQLFLWNLADQVTRYDPGGPQAKDDVFHGVAEAWKSGPPSPAFVSFAPSGKHLLVADHLETHLLDLATGAWEKGFYYGGHASFAATPDGRTLAVGLRGRNIQLWDVPSKQLRATLSGHLRSVTALAFRPDGKVLASGDQFLDQLWWVRGGAIKLWSAEPRRPLGHDQPPRNRTPPRQGGS